MTPTEDLLTWCHASNLDQIQISAVGVHKWKSGLVKRIAALGPDIIDTIDTIDTYGMTALGRLTAYRPPEELKPLFAQGVEQLLAAGANPLAGKNPALLRGNVFSEDIRVNKMLAALVSAQRSGAPYRVAGTDGNLLHAMVNGNIGVFAHLAQDRFSALEGCRDVVVAWRDEVDAQGKTPVDLAWEWYPTSSGTQAEGETAALWFLLLPGRSGIWQPPPMDMRCADGQLLYQRVLLKVDQGMDVPRRAEALVEQLRAMALNEDMTKDTPEANNTHPVRANRL